MPSAFAETSLPMVVESPRKRWTRAECERFENAGLLDLRWMELVEGDLISKMNKKRPHVNTASELALWLFESFGGQYVQPEAPIDVSPEDNPTSEPVPDFVLLRIPFREFREENPHPEHIRLIIEVSDTSVAFDLRIKAGLYARAGIVEYWVVDIPRRRIVVHREPSEGRYLSKTVYAEHETLSPLESTAQLLVSSVLPKP